MKKLSMLAVWLPLVAMAEAKVTNVWFSPGFMGWSWTLTVKANIDGTEHEFVVEDDDFIEGTQTETTDRYSFKIKDSSNKYTLSGLVVETEQPLVGDKYVFDLSINDSYMGNYVLGVVKWTASGGFGGGSVDKEEYWSWPYVKAERPKSYGYGGGPVAEKTEAFVPTSKADCSKLIPNLWGANLTQEQADRILKPYYDCLEKFKD